MNEKLAGPWIRRFLIEYVIDERNYSPNTQHSYRDMFRLFLPFAAKRCRCTMDQLPLERIKPKLLREFAGHLQQARHCGPCTINQRLTALRSWAGFVGSNCPELLEWSRQMKSVRFRKQPVGPRNYLEKAEMKELLAAPNQKEEQGFRDYALLLFLYNTGARVSEASQLIIGDLDLVSSVATLQGKGRKRRQCPLWQPTVATLRRLTLNREATQAVFLNRNGQPLTRYGIRILVRRHARNASLKATTLRSKRVSPHTIRHAAAMALLRAGVDINTIRIWLGHVSLQTTHLYAESDLEMKAQALACCEAPLLQSPKTRTGQKGLMGFLATV
jgi:site-specific recombinase XerD